MKKIGKKASVILLRVFLALCAVVVGVNLYLANADRLAGNKLPTPFGYGAAVVLSGSMEPTLSVNDLIVVKVSDSYAVNDIVVFQDQNSLTVHRIISIEGDTVQTQGDANNAPDAPMDLSRVKGKVILTVPALGWVFDVIKSPVGTVLLLGLALWLLFRSYRNERMEDEKKLEAIKAEIRRLKDADGTSAEPASESEVDADEQQ